MYPVGYIIMLNDSLKLSYLSTSSIYLFVQSLVTFLILADLTSKAKAVSTSLLIILLSLFIETIGVQTGFPFGSYEYTKVLSPIFPGGVPLAIAFAWMTLSVNSFIILKYFLKNKNKYFVILLSGLLIAFIDVLLEPFASFINNYWIWAGSTIPFQNYLSWFVIGTAFSFILDIIIGKYILSVKISFPIIVLASSIFQFLLINILNNYYFNSVIGISGILIIFLTLFYLLKNEK
jgi:putative membrane protein